MLSDATKSGLKAALDVLRDGNRGAWEALAPLAGLSRAGTEISVDFSTVALLGAPVIVARIAPTPAPPTISGLTPRQSEVAACLAEGLPNKLIARRLGIGLATVKDHVHAILAHTGARSRAELIVRLHAPKASPPAAPDPSIEGWDKPI